MNDEIEIKVKELAKSPEFEGVVMWARHKRPESDGRETTGWAMLSSKGMNAWKTRTIVQDVLGRLEKPESLSTDGLIKELLLRPGFRGLIVQELGHEGREVTGRTEFRSHVPSNIPLAEAVQILRTCADKLEARLPPSPTSEDS